MSSPSPTPTNSGGTRINMNLDLCHTPRPLILAAYRAGDPSRKRRVKVAPDMPWEEFLVLLRSRLEIPRETQVEICDERNIEIVSVEDLVDNEVLVVKERHRAGGGAPPWGNVPMSSWGGQVPPKSSAWGNYDSNTSSWGAPGGVAPSWGVQGGVTPTSTPFNRSHDQMPMMSSKGGVPGNGNGSRSRQGQNGDSASSGHVILGVPHLSHFIQCNSFGYYFLAEADNMKLQQQGQGKGRKAHCIVKVPHVQDTLRILESEAGLLNRISQHKSIISPPTLHTITFTEDRHQTFYFSLPQQKQTLLRQLFSVGGAIQAYVYPLYGVTMATKIKSGLSPERVLKYVYQLVDIMQFLQQRGVIHQTLLPENIQVMSNDRVIVCNLETAVETEPNSCLMVVSGSLAPPSNRSGLAPEVISAFNRLRVESETIDYSSQYPWTFGVLSILIATGTHPLQGYPAQYEDTPRIRYRSHHLEALPSPDKYPRVFLKLVKRSMSCDPASRPTLPQILTILKRDPKILSLMTGNRLPAERGGGSRRGSAGGMSSADQMQQLPTQGPAVSSNHMAPAPSRGSYDPPTTTAASDVGFVRENSLPASSGHQQYSGQYSASSGSHSVFSKQPSEQLTAGSGQHSLSLEQQTARTGQHSLNSGQHSLSSGQQTASSGQHSALLKQHSLPVGLYASQDGRQNSSVEQASFSGYHSLPRSGQPTITSPTHTKASPTGHPLPHRANHHLRLWREPIRSYPPSYDRPTGSHDSHVTSPSGGSGPLSNPFSPQGHQQQGTSPKKEAGQQLPATAPMTAWCTFGETPPTSSQGGAAVEAKFAPLSGSGSRSKLPLKRYSSTGAFSDDFVLKSSSSKDSSSAAGGRGLLYQSSKLSSSSPYRLYASTEHLSHAGRQHRSKNRLRLGRSVELLSDNSNLATSEGDFTTLQDFNYKRLVQSPNGASSQDTSPATIRRGGGADTEQLLCHSSPEDENTESAQRDPQNILKNPEHQEERMRRHSEQYPRTSREPQERQRASEGIIRAPTSGDTSLERLGNLTSDLFQQFPLLRTDHSTSTLVDVEEQSLEPLVNKTDPLTPDLTPTEAQGGLGSKNIGDGGQSSGMAPPSSQPMQQSSLDVFPTALDSEVSLLENHSSSDNLLQLQRAEPSRDNPFRLIPRSAATSDEGLTPNTGHAQDTPPSRAGGDTVHSPSPTSNLSDQLSSSPSGPSGSLPSSSSGPSSGLNNPRSTPKGGPAYENVIMSPIPEASQELTSSMSQTLNSPPVSATSRAQPTNSAQPTNRPAGTQFQFAVRASTETSPASVSLEGKPSSSGSSSGNLSSSNAALLSGMETPSGHRATSPSTDNQRNRGGRSHGDQVMERVGESHDKHVTRTDVSTASSMNVQVGRETTSSIGQETRRSSTPQQASTTPPPPLSIDGAAGGSNRDGTRPLSPLATTTFSMNNAIPPPPIQQGGVQTRPQDPQGNENTVVIRRHHQAGGGGAGGRAYSQQRHEAKLQQRISQDLEMMNLAISGMDAGSYSQLVSITRLQGGVASGRGKATSGGGKLTRSSSSVQSSSRSQAHYRPSPSTTSSHHTRHHTTPAPQTTLTNPAPVSATPSTGTVPQSSTATTFRPITPALSSQQTQQRSSSAPSNRHLDVTPALVPPPILQAQHAAAPNRQLQSSHEDRVPNGHHHRGNPSGGGARGDHAMVVVQPPQVTADSYDYLPPYSPPSAGAGGYQPRPQQPQQQPPAQQQQQWAYATPTPREASTAGEYGEPPPSYHEIFGGMASEPSRSHGRGTRHRSHDPPRQNQSGQSDRGSVSRQPGRLTSFTNLFRRARRHSRQGGDRSATPDGNVGDLAMIDDYTAQWVESYSHTPRPHNLAPLSALPLHTQPSSSTPTTPISARSHTTQQNYSPIPYRDPPPLTPLESLPREHQTPPPMAGGQGAASRATHGSLSRLPIESGSRSPGVVPRNRSRDRPRPVSAYLPLETRPHASGSPLATNFHPSPLAARVAMPTQANSTHSTPRQPYSRLVNHPTSPLSASCSNLVASEVPKKPKQSKLTRRSSGRGFYFIPPSSAANQVGASSSRHTSAGGRRREEIQVRTVERERGVSQGVVGIQRQPGVEDLTAAHPVASQEGAGPSTVAAGNKAKRHSHKSNSGSNIVSRTATPSSNRVTPPDSRASVTPTDRTGTHNASCTSSRVNINMLSGSSVLSQVTPDAVLGSNPNLSPANLHSSSHSTSELSVTNSTSSRTAARLRAETRREAILTSSDDDDSPTDQLHHLHRGARGRPRRRRSQGSGGYRSLESVNRIEEGPLAEGVSPVGEVENLGEVGRAEQEGGVALRSTATSPETRGSSRGSLDSPPVIPTSYRSQGSLDSVPAITSGRSQRSLNSAPVVLTTTRSQTSIHERAIDVVDIATLRGCGHRCEGGVGRVGVEPSLCCVCRSKNSGGPQDTPSGSATGDCSLCERRQHHTHYPLDHTSQSPPTSVTKLLSPPQHPNDQPTPPGATTASSPDSLAASRARANKNCVVM